MSTTSPPRPKLGLALSGGGFRAAFFHIGVLARLAERGRLRPIEVISTVSGGSIVGALYYLHVRDLLQAKERPADDDYVAIVERMEDDFLRATEANIRALATADLRKNFRMRKADYSRSDRLGELYDELLYRPAWNNPLFSAPPAPRTTPIEMRELLVQPAGHDGPFHPEKHNEGRDAPVPMLLVNATSLNTGHNWRFEATAMGEPLRSHERWVEIDKNARYARTHWDELSEHQANFPLGMAVAASACVPGLFHPLAVSDLFEGKRVQLVDGGVHDNQGVGGLFDSDCTELIVSDASGQMSDQDEPSTKIPAAVGRSTQGIYGDRVREEQLSDAWRNYRSVIVHLRRGLPTHTYYPRPAQGLPERPAKEDGVRDYGVDARAADWIARTRTDLDAFSEIEACSLELYGYRMAGVELGRQGHTAERARNWRFLRMSEPLAQPGDVVLAHLQIATKRFFKGARSSWPATAFGAVLAFDGLAAAVAVAYWLAQLPGWANVGIAVAVIALVALYLMQRIRIAALRRFADLVFTRVSPGLLAPILWLNAQVTIGLTPTFLAAGRIDTLSEAEQTEGASQAPVAGS